MMQLAPLFRGLGIADILLRISASAAVRPRPMTLFCVSAAASIHERLPRMRRILFKEGNTLYER